MGYCSSRATANWKGQQAKTLSQFMIMGLMSSVNEPMTTLLLSVVKVHRGSEVGH